MGTAKNLTSEPTGTLQLKGYDPTPSFVVGRLAEKPPSTPSEWFGKKFPSTQQRLGPAFLESISVDSVGTKRVTPVSINQDFFSGVVGGDQKLQHRVVFLTTEQSFYFFDPCVQMFSPTTEEKLKLLLSQMLVRCAVEMPNNVAVGPLFNEFREDDLLRSIIKKAKALLAADASFFSPDSTNQRAKGPETHERLARTFIRKAIKPDPLRMLTVRECFELFTKFCKLSGMAPVERRIFTPIVEDLVREEYALNLRKDVLGDNNRMQRGWKGLSVDLADALAVEKN